jgi:hypothetical protein
MDESVVSLGDNMAYYSITASKNLHINGGRSAGQP